MDKNQLYAALGVPEFWRYTGQEWRIYRLQGTVYQEWERSPTFPLVEKTDLYHFLEQAQEDEIAAEEALRQLIGERIVRLE